MRSVSSHRQTTLTEHPGPDDTGLSSSRQPATAEPEVSQSGLPALGHRLRLNNAGSTQAPVVCVGPRRWRCDKLVTTQHVRLLPDREPARALMDANLFLKRTLPRAGLWVHPRTDDSLNLGEPDEYNGRVARFLSMVERCTWHRRDEKPIRPGRLSWTPASQKTID